MSEDWDESESIDGGGAEIDTTGKTLAEYLEELRGKYGIRAPIPVIIHKKDDKTKGGDEESEESKESEEKLAMEEPEPLEMEQPTSLEMKESEPLEMKESEPLKMKQPPPLEIKQVESNESETLVFDDNNLDIISVSQVTQPSNTPKNKEYTVKVLEIPIVDDPVNNTDSKNPDSKNSDTDPKHLQYIEIIGSQDLIV